VKYDNVLMKSVSYIMSFEDENAQAGSIESMDGSLYLPLSLRNNLKPSLQHFQL
jgi:hypothetical protein